MTWGKMKREDNVTQLLMQSFDTDHAGQEQTCSKQMTAPDIL